MKLTIKQGYDRLVFTIDDENDAARIMADLVPYCDVTTSFTVEIEVLEEENDDNL